MATKQVMEWTKVADKEPDRPGHYIVYCCEDWCFQRWVTVAQFCSYDYWVDFDAEERLYGITHWMPLPAPPEDDK